MTWTLDVTVTPGADGSTDFKGPYIQGPPGGRFIYLNWGTVDSPGGFNLFRRAKLWLDAVPPDVLRDAADQGVLVGRLGLTDRPQGKSAVRLGPPAADTVDGRERVTPRMTPAEYGRQ